MCVTCSNPPPSPLTQYKSRGKQPSNPRGNGLFHSHNGRTGRVNPRHGTEEQTVATTWRPRAESILHINLGCHQTRSLLPHHQTQSLLPLHRVGLLTRHSGWDSTMTRRRGTFCHEFDSSIVIVSGFTSM